MAKILGNNPLLAKPVEEEPVLTEEEVAAIRAAQSDVDEFTTMSFKIRKTYLKKLRDYAYTNRVEIKYALDEALALLLDKIDDAALMEYPEKTRKPRKRGNTVL